MYQNEKTFKTFLARKTNKASTALVLRWGFFHLKPSYHLKMLMDRQSERPVLKGLKLYRATILDRVDSYMEGVSALFHITGIKVLTEAFSLLSFLYSETRFVSVSFLLKMVGLNMAILRRLVDLKYYSGDIVLARRSRGLTQTELAKNTGISQSKIAKIENGTMFISEELIEKISVALNYPKGFFTQNITYIKYLFH